MSAKHHVNPSPDGIWHLQIGKKHTTDSSVAATSTKYQSSFLLVRASVRACARACVSYIFFLGDGIFSVATSRSVIQSHNPLGTAATLCGTNYLELVWEKLCSGKKVKVYNGVPELIKMVHDKRRRALERRNRLATPCIVNIITYHSVRKY